MTKYNIDFASQFKVTTLLSVVMVVGSLALFFTKGLNYGVDFKGGAELQVAFGDAISLEDLRDTLEKEGLSASSVQSIGEELNREFLIKVAADEDSLSQATDSLIKALETDFAAVNPEVLKTDIVGPKAGESLRIAGFQAMAWALLAIMVYIGLRFDYKYSPGAIVALFHDVVIIIGVFALTGREFGLQIVGALLAVIGYSVNDTVVVYDRVREHEVLTPLTELKKIINTALNETLNRTILTSLTTFMVAAIMFAMGGGVIHDFFFAICLGVIVGTYSSIYVAAPTVLFFEKFLPKEAEEEEVTA